MMLLRYFPSLVLLVSGGQAMYHMYLTGYLSQHNVVPFKKSLEHVTHVALAFMPSSIFNIINQTDWPLFTSVDAARESFVDGTAIMVAVGGWGDTAGFEKAAASKEGRLTFASNVRAMVDSTGADGVDIDWEYPGGNGEDYKRIPNSEKVWEIEAYVELLHEIRKAIGPDKLISAAVPGKPEDMMAFTQETVPKIAESVDFLNIMTYDLMNRRDNVTKHHAGVSASLTAVNEYLSNGLPREKANLGFAFYIKWFKTDPEGGCDINPVGCKTTLMEDPETGADLGQTGGFSWHDKIPQDVERSYLKALKHGQYDSESGGHFYWDADEDRFWTWESPEAITTKFDQVVVSKGLGGSFAWGLGEDAPDFEHFDALTSKVREHSARYGSMETSLQHCLTRPGFQMAEGGRKVLSKMSFEVQR